MNDLKNETINGFAIYAGDGNVMSGLTYSTNYCRINGMGGSGPLLIITMQ